MSYLSNQSTILSASSSFCFRADLLSCIADDPLCSTIVDLRKNVIGKEFEEYLEMNLRKLSICFETEAELRLQGKPKTPDALLLIPMSVQVHGSNYLVNWIDSKGMFADAETFLEHEQQLKGYVNRYGHGLVIYWYGHVELPTTVDNIYITDGFPDVWIWPTGETAKADVKPSFDAKALYSYEQET